MRKYNVIVVEDENTIFETKASTGGVMADGRKTWEFPEMDENGIYTAEKMVSRKTGKQVLVLFKQ